MELQPEHEQDNQQRTFLVLLLLMAMFFVWSTMMAPRTAPEEKADEGQKAEKADTAKATPATKTGTAAAPTPKGKAPAIGKAPAKAPPTKAEPPAGPAPEALPEPELKKVERRSKLFRAVLTNQDGALESLTLLDYFRDPPSQAKAHRARTADPKADVTEYGLPLLGQAGTEPSLVLTDREAGGQAVSALFGSRRYDVVVTDDANTVVLRSTFDTWQVTKTYRLPGPDDEQQRHLSVAIEVKNVGQANAEFPGYRLRGAGGLSVDIGPAAWKHNRVLPTAEERKAEARNMAAAVALGGQGEELNVARSSASSLADEAIARSDARVAWAGVQNNYFAVILDPVVAADGENWVWSGGASALGEHGITSSIETGSMVLEPGQGVVHAYRLYAGPKLVSALEAYGEQYEKVIEPSKLHFLRVVLYAVLRGAYTVLPNWGVAIIILTIVVRIVLHPLSKKSQVSMGKMQKLQPQLKDLREKYKNDKKRQQQEMMTLYREYGVNPMGGCLPMILQIPVFIGLWGVLRESIELRHAPFVFWVRDLSQPDAFMGTVNILPLLCVVVMFIQQKMMPKSPDPQQQQTQKIMGYMMPALLGFMFYGLASGVALYFSASMFLGIVEQKRIKSHLDRMGDLKPVERKPDKQARKAVGQRSRPARVERKRKSF